MAASPAASFECGVRGVQLVCRLEELPRFEFTTGRFVDTAAASSLRAFFSARLADPTAFVCLDAPGMGKTTTVERAADMGGAVYIRFSSSGIMSSALSRSRTLLNAEAAAAVGGTSARGGTAGVVAGDIAENICTKVWKLALVACMDRCREGLETTRGRMLNLCDGNGVNFNVADADVQSTIEESRTALLGTVKAAALAAGSDWRADAPIVLHFDEIQSLLPEPRLHDCVKDRRPPAPASPSECMQYSLVWFSSALREICVGGCIRPCMTGISVDAVDSLRFDSSIKRWPLEPLPYFGADMVKQVLAAYVHFDADADLETVVCGVAGCPRAVQHALLVVRQRAEALGRGESVPPITCAQLAVEAYDSWRASGVSVYLRGQAEHLPAAEEAFLCTCYPTAWAAVGKVVDGVPVATMDAGSVPRPWREAAHAGVLRLRLAGDVATLFPPYPFLERYIRSLGPRRLPLCNCIELIERARVMPMASGAMGRGKAFEFAVALELCLPGSALLRAILACEQLRALGLRPLARDVLPLRKFADLAALGDVSEEVLIVSDGGSSAKPGDVAVPVQLRDSTPQWLVVEVKSSTAAELDYVRAGQVDFAKKMHSVPMQRFCFSCFLPALDTRAQRRKPVKAEIALAALNAPAAGSEPQRYMGLVVLDDALLAACTLDLASILRCEEHTERTEAQWYKLVFSDVQARARIAAELHVRADAVSGITERVGSMGVGTARTSMRAVGSAGGGAPGGAESGEDETTQLRRELRDLKAAAAAAREAAEAEVAELQARLARKLGNK